MTAQAEALSLFAAGNFRFREGPSLRHKVLRVIPRGARFDMIERSGDWYKVQFQNRVGYVHKSGITHPLLHRLPDKKEFSDLDQAEKAEFASCINQTAINGIDPDLESYVTSIRNALRPPEKETPPARQSDMGFIWPTGGRISSHFGIRTHSIHGTRTFHKGLDIAGGDRAPVVAAKSGRISISAAGCVAGRAHRHCNGGAGNMIVIDHGDGTKTRYLHLNPSCRLPARGSRVVQGEKIGCVGMTGYATGPHLHFEILQNGRWLNPHNCLPRR
jgi:murein DD-endopeptidase MepM/ murein hydrolase activator NlpD